MTVLERETFGHEPFIYDSGLWCMRCWTLHKGQRLLVPWPCTSAIVLGLVPRDLDLELRVLAHYMKEKSVETDYEPGDFPVPNGALVEYFGSRTHGRYVVDERVDPSTSPRVRPEDDVTEIYPDGAAYHLWPEGVPHKMGNRHLSVLFVRRTSFRVVVED